MNVVMADIMGRALKKAADAIGDKALAVETDVADRVAGPGPARRRHRHGSAPSTC
jgi:hypothetical protein